MSGVYVIAAAMLLAILGGSGTADAATIYGKARVINGDTLIVSGIWRGEFTAPWEWRQAQWEKTPNRPTLLSKQGSQSCVIKGNISSKGERIYHVRGGRYYGKTKISQSKGERWFCSEAEARAAGWRRSKR